MAVDFYHLTASPLERVLPQICDRLLSGGERLLIVADDPLLDQLDVQLWRYARDAFLPHGRSNGASPEAQPILLSAGAEPLNQADNIAIADGRWRDEALDFARTFYFFGAAQLDEARMSWRALKAGKEIELRYWKQDERGKWVQGP
ncbi:MAG: DNA polymerase III subunit chi [Sphingosinicella sp.]|nr:DNA polymerase III subunit chi [Sphingosinicella sp.]